jgi:DUF917 family protein
MEIKLVTREGEIKTLLRRRGEDVVGMDAAAVWETGSRAPLPTVMYEGMREGTRVAKLPGAWDMCVEAPVSKNHSVELGGVAPVVEVWSAAIRAEVSHGDRDDAAGG